MTVRNISNPLMINQSSDFSISRQDPEQSILGNASKYVSGEKIQAQKFSSDFFLLSLLFACDETPVSTVETKSSSENNREIKFDDGRTIHLTLCTNVQDVTGILSDNITIDGVMYKKGSKILVNCATAYGETGPYGHITISTINVISEPVE